MSENNNPNAIEILVNFLTKQFTDLPDFVDNKEFISKFDSLLGIQIKKEDISLLKKFVQFCYNRMQDMKLKENSNDKFYEGYSSNLVLQINSLNNKINQLEDKIKKLEIQNNSCNIKINSLISENSDKDTEIQFLKKKNFESEGNNKGLTNKIDELTTEVTNLREDKIKLENDNISLKNQIRDLQTNFALMKKKHEAYELNSTNKNNMLENTIQKQNNRICELRKAHIESEKSSNEKINQLFSQILDMNSQINELKSNMKHISERDNYNAIIYIILVSSGMSFENIYTNIKTITNDINNMNIKENLKNLLIYSNEFVMDYNCEAHNSTNINIFEKLFTKSYVEFKDLFTDDILNQTKNIIRGMKNYILCGKNDVKFENDMKNVANAIKSSFNKL